MVNERDNPRIFKEARYFGHHYFLGHFKVILWSDHITVIGNIFDKVRKYERIDFYRRANKWHCYESKRTFITKKAFT